MFILAEEWAESPHLHAGAWGDSTKPTINLTMPLDGWGVSHKLGGDDNEAMMEFWRGLPQNGRLAYVVCTEDELYHALRELHITQRFIVEGTPNEHVAVEVGRGLVMALHGFDGGDL
jgi:hypothetical protein